MDDLDVRWRQRLDHFSKAYSALQVAIAIKQPSLVERAGLIQLFEMTFELAWKLLKDYLEAQGFQIKSPREAIKQAFQSNLIFDGHSWIDALEDRNLTSHTYNEQTAVAVEGKIRERYYPLLEELTRTFKGL